MNECVHISLKWKCFYLLHMSENDQLLCLCVCSLLVFFIHLSYFCVFVSVSFSLVWLHRSCSSIHAFVDFYSYSVDVAVIVCSYFTSFVIICFQFFLLFPSYVGCLLCFLSWMIAATVFFTHVIIIKVLLLWGKHNKR